MKNKAVSKATREKAEEALTKLHYCLNGMFRLVKGLKTDSKEVEGGLEQLLTIGVVVRMSILDTMVDGSIPSMNMFSP